MTTADRFPDGTRPRDMAVDDEVVTVEVDRAALGFHIPAGCATEAEHRLAWLADLFTDDRTPRWRRWRAYDPDVGP